MTLFLYRDRLLDLQNATNPLKNGQFPLTEEQFAGVTLDDLMQLLTEGLADDPNLERDNPKYIVVLCHLMNEKGNVNAIRVQDDGQGPVLSCARIPDQSLSVLEELRDRGALSEETVEEAVWKPLA